MRKRCCGILQRSNQIELLASDSVHRRCVHVVFKLRSVDGEHRTTVCVRLYIELMCMNYEEQTIRSAWDITQSAIVWFDQTSKCLQVIRTFVHRTYNCKFIICLFFVYYCNDLCVNVSKNEYNKLCESKYRKRQSLHNKNYKKKTHTNTHTRASTSLMIVRQLQICGHKLEYFLFRIKSTLWTNNEQIVNFVSSTNKSIVDWTMCRRDNIRTIRKYCTIRYSANEEKQNNNNRWDDQKKSVETKQWCFDWTNLNANNNLNFDGIFISKYV